MLGLLCPSIELKLRAARFEKLALDHERRARLIALHDAILTGNPVRRDDETVERFNRLQVSNSTRFIYASRDNFSLAREVLQARPDLKHVRTQLRAGRLGEGPPRRAGMLDGLWLVLQGSRSHYMLPIEAWEADAEPIEASTRERGTLAMVVNDAPLVQAEIFDSGQSRRMIREVAVEVVALGPPARFRIVHNNPSLNQLMEMINARRAEPRSES